MENSFYAAIIGASFALIGVFITLKQNQRHFEANLREEREKTKEEREFLAKHKALLSAVEAVTQFVNYYLTLPDRELPKGGNTPKEISEMGISMNRLHFYCGIDTIKQSTAMGQVLGKAYAQAIKAKMSAMFIAEEIKGIEVQVENIKGVNKELKQEILALLSADRLSSTIISHRQLIVNNCEQILKFENKKVDLVKENFQATEICRDVVVNSLKEVYGSLCNVLLIARKELNFPIDELEYAALLNKTTEETITITNNLLNEIRSEINRRMQ